MNALALRLAVVEWQFFCTLTHRTTKLSERKRYHILYAFLRSTAKLYGVHFSRLYWAARSELGELTGRPHFHLLLAGVPKWAECDKGRYSIKATWAQFDGGGHADVRLWERGRDAAGYITKNDDFDHVGANRYESGKYGSAGCQVTLSRSLEKREDALVRKSLRRERRGCPHPARGTKNFGRCLAGASG